MFDHSSISYFIERVGREGFSGIFHGLNEELLRLDLLSPEMYADSSLVKANVNSQPTFSTSRYNCNYQASFTPLNPPSPQDCSTRHQS